MLLVALKQPNNADEGLDVGVLDLRWLCPLDIEGLHAAVRSAAGKVVVLHEEIGPVDSEQKSWPNFMNPGNEMALKLPGSRLRHENSRSRFSSVPSSHGVKLSRRSAFDQVTAVNPRR